MLVLVLACVGAVGGCSGASRPVPVERALPAGPAAPVLEAAVPDSAEVAWRREVGPSLFAAPSVLGPVVLVATGHGEVAALSAETGERYWKRRLEGPLRGLVARGDRLYAAADRENGRAFALDLRDGAPLWSSVVGAAPYAPAVVGDTVLVATDAGDVYALDAGSGRTLWRALLPGSAASPPVAAGGAVLVATRTDTLFHLTRAAGGTAARVPLPAGVSAAPLAWDGLLLLPLRSGELLAYDPAARRVRWAADLGEPILAAPVRSRDGAAYVLTRAAEVWRVPAGGSEPRRLASLGGAAVGSLAVAGDRIVVGRLDGELFVLAADGTVLWSRRLGDSIVAPAAVSGGAIYAPLLHGTIVKIRGAR